MSISTDVGRTFGITSLKISKLDKVSLSTILNKIPNGKQLKEFPLKLSMPNINTY